MTITADKLVRQSERVAISLPVTVEARDINKQIWRELTYLDNVSDIGACFYLSRFFEVGRLVFLKLPMDKDLRRYDHEEEYYCVWAIIRHCRRILRNHFSVYHIGAAFIGREPPSGYRLNPLTIYELGELNENGFWRISESAQKPSTRRQPRYSIPVEIFIAVCDAQNKLIAHETTVTENISEGGASVFSGLQLNIGDKIKVIKQHGNFSADAIVRNRRTGKDNLPRLHLEFINVRFPLDGID